MTDKLQKIKLIDSILGNILNSSSIATGQIKVPYENIPLSSSLGFKASALTKNAFESVSKPVEMESGQDIYEKWKDLTLTVQKQAQYCDRRCNDSFKQMCELEESINACYERGDALIKACEKTQARKAAVDMQIESLKGSVNETHRDIASLEQKVKDLEEQKEIYDILRWIPLVNIFSEIVAAIDGTRSLLQAKKDELDKRSKDLQNLYNEWNTLQRETDEAKRKIHENEMERMQLEEKRKACQKQRDTASQEVIDWKNRERYCLNIEKEMKHLIVLKADVEEFHKLLADNPPPFQLNF